MLGYEQEATRLVPEEYENCAQDDHTTQVFTPQVLGETLVNTGASIWLSTIAALTALTLAVATAFVGRKQTHTAR